jgi:hypothetical protein
MAAFLSGMNALSPGDDACPKYLTFHFEIWAFLEDS